MIINFATLTYHYLDSHCTNASNFDQSVQKSAFYNPALNSESVFCRRQSQTYIGGPHTERIKIFLMAVDP